MSAISTIVDQLCPESPLNQLALPAPADDLPPGRALDPLAEVAAVITHFIDRAATCERIHSAAAAQIDAAAYALNSLIEELSELMVLPPRPKVSGVIVLHRSAPASDSTDEAIAA